MSTVHVMKRPTSCLQTMKFRTYNAAIDFASKSGLLKPTKPYKRTMYINGSLEPVWCVTLAQTFKPANATFERKAA